MQAERDTGADPTKVKVSDAELATVHLTPHAFHGDWNYELLTAGNVITQLRSEALARSFLPLGERITE